MNMLQKLTRGATRTQAYRATRRITGARAYSVETPKPKSQHAQWYSDILPAMAPIFLLGSAIYLGLQLAQVRLSHEKFMDESNAKIRQLEEQVVGLEKTPVSTGAAMQETGDGKKSGSGGWKFW